MSRVMPSVPSGRAIAALRPNSDGMINLASTQVERMAGQYAAESFEEAVGEQDNAMRLTAFVAEDARAGNHTVLMARKKSEIG